MQRRKFVVGLGSLAAGSAAVLGTGAYRGADVETDRSLSVSFEDDSAAMIQLIPSSPFASETTADAGGVERASGVGDAGGKTIKIDVSRLNVNADTRLNDVFRVRNTTGSDVDLTVADDPATDGANAEPIFIYADDGSGETRVDDGSGVNLGPGEHVEINFVFNFKNNDVNSLPDTLLVNAEGAT
jgi:hypothetical protein